MIGNRGKFTIEHYVEVGSDLCESYNMGYTLCPWRIHQHAVISGMRKTSLSWKQ